MILPLNGEISMFGGNLNQALGTADSDSGRLCSDGYNGSTYAADGRINKMAKRKPVRRNNVGILTDAEHQHDSNYTDFWGLKMPVGSPDPISAATEVHAWEYLRPRNMYADGEPARLLDFRGYQTDAVGPIAAVEAQTVALLQQTSFPFYFQYKKDGDTYQFGLKEMPISNGVIAPALHLSDCYLAIAFVYNGNTYYRTSQYTIGSDSILGADTIVFNRSDFPSVSSRTDMTYYVVAAKLRYWIGDTKPGGGQMFYAIPFPSQSGSYNTLTLNPAAPASISITLQKIARGVPGAGIIWNNMEDSSYYTPVKPLENNHYLEISNANPNVHFGLLVTNSGNADFVFDLNGVAMQLAPSQDLSNPTGYVHAAGVYASDSPSSGMTERSWGLTVPAHSSLYVLLRTVNDFGRYINGVYHTIDTNRQVMGGLVQMRLSGGDQTIGSNQINLQYSV